MAKSDWKDLLSGLNTENNTADNDVQATIRKEDNPSQKSGITEAVASSDTRLKQELVLRFEKRNGKPATILSRFQGSETELKALAAALKKHCGTGGSAKDDEILIQGDVRDKVADYLRRQGHRVKGDFKK